MRPDLARQLRKILRNNLLHRVIGEDQPLRLRQPIIESSAPVKNAQTPGVRAFYNTSFALREIRSPAVTPIAADEVRGARTYCMEVVKSKIERQAEQIGQFQN